MRLRQLSPWVQSWATEDMFAVKAGKGADAAWYRSAVLREEALMMAKPFSGACDDIWKAYDSVSRETAIVAAMAAGFPSIIARTYLSYHSNIVVRHCLALGLGAPRRRSLGIPQGCPWSNMLLGNPSGRCFFACAPPVSPRGFWRMIWRPWLWVSSTTPG